MRGRTLLVVAFSAALTRTGGAQAPAPATPDNHARLAQLPRDAGEKHPYETDTATVLRYFEMPGACAEAQRLSMQ